MSRPRGPVRRGAVTLMLVVLAACSSSSRSPSASAPSTTRGPTTSPAPSTTAPQVARPRSTVGRSSTPTTSAPASVPPFRATVSGVGAAELRLTYRAGCPVGPGSLRAVHVSYWGFDDRAHAGTIIVAASVAVAVIAVFRTLYAERFPIRQMQPEDAFGGQDPASMAADNTSGFNCRYAVAPGAPQWSAHAFGTAIDVNPVENPYLAGGRVQPANGAPFVDRARVRPGMAEPGGELNEAFAAIGWQWGGRWSAPDYQHFSANGG